MKSPTEMTPDRLRLMANRCEMRGDPATAFVLRDLASAWEADRKRLEKTTAQADRQYVARCKLVIEADRLEAHIEELERLLQRGQWVHGFMGDEGEVIFLTDLEKLDEFKELVAEGIFLRWEVEPLTRVEYDAAIATDEERP